MNAIAHAPPAYVRAVAEHLETSEPDLWAWFRSDDFQGRYRAATETELLRTAVRLEPIGPNARRYQLAARARDTLGLSLPVTLHQSLETGGVPNAMLLFVPGEIVIVFQGRILELMASDAELLDLVGHEISHHKLLSVEGGRYHTVDRMLRWLATREGAADVFGETWRRVSLFTEIYCDIGGLVACGDVDATIRGLVKAIADFKDADAASYLAQTRELVSRGPGATRGITHPELHVRALAIANAHLPSEAFEAAIAPLVLGPIEIGGLDLLDQRQLVQVTRRLVERALAQPGVHSDLAVAHGRALLPDLDSKAAPVAVQLGARPLAASALDYLSYVLLDLALVDRRPAALADCLRIAEEIDAGPRFREIARHELKSDRSMLAALGRRTAT